MSKQQNKRNRILIVIIFTGTVGAFLGNLNSFKGFIDTYLPKNNPESDFYGIWYSEYSYPFTGGKVSVVGTTEYFKTGGYNFTGEVELDMNETDPTCFAHFNLDGTGKWQADKKTLSIQLEDSKSSLKALKINDQPIDIANIEMITGEKFPALDEYLPKKLNDEFLIIKSEKENIVLQANDLEGNPLSMVLERRKCPLMRSITRMN